jgi:hypothetical protein
MKKILIAAGALAIISAGSLSADDTMKKSTTAKKTTTKTVSKIKSEGPVDRSLEFRVGPRVTWLSGDVRLGSGTPGDTVDIFDDLQLDDASLGLAIDLDWQPINRWHVAVGMTFDDYDQTSATSRNITSAVGGDIIQSGASVSAQGDVYTFEGKIGYDLIKNNTYRLQPFIGGKGIVVDNGRVTGSGTIIDPAGVARSGTRTASESTGYGTFVGGLDQRLFLTRSWYVGAEVAGFGLDNWAYVAGDGYTGYDFTRNFGVRVGYDANYVNYENSNRKTEVDVLLGAAYVQAVVGF